MMTTGAYFADEEEEERPFKTRRVFSRYDYGNSTWARDYLDHPDLHSPGSRVARDFRRGFRVPYPLFLQPVQLVRDKGWFPDVSEDIAGRPCPTLELKVPEMLCTHSRDCR